MSPVLRHRLPPTSLPQSHGLAVPHSQMLSTIGRPAASSAARILAYEAFASCERGAAPVVFQIVHAPGGVLNGILIFVAEAAGASGTSLRACVGIHAKFQPERMNVVSNGFHAMRKALRVGDDVGIRVAADLPAVVNDDVDVARIFHAGLHDGVGHALDEIFADVAGELVPRVPAHGRGQRQVRRRRGFVLRRQTGRKQAGNDEKREEEGRKNKAARFHADVLSEAR